MIEIAEPKSWVDETYLAEILQYEDPHFVLVHEDEHFESGFKSVSSNPESMKHPAVKAVDLWEGLYAGHLIAEGVIRHQRDKDPDGFLYFLRAAEQVCPDLLLIQENLVSAYGSIGDFDRAEEILHSLYGKRKDAKILLGLYVFTEDERYKQEIIDEYSIHMFNYLIRSLP